MMQKIKRLLFVLVLGLIVSCDQNADNSAETPPNNSSSPVAIVDERAVENDAADSDSAGLSMSDNAMMSGGMMSGAPRTVSFDGIEQNDSLSADAVTIIKQAAKHPEISQSLAVFDRWDANAAFDEGTWWLEFYTDNDWIGWAGVDGATGDLVDYEMLTFYSDAELSDMQPKLLAAALSDPEMQQIISDPTLYWQDTGYDPYEGYWYAAFYREAEAWLAVIYEENDKLVVDRIVDPEALEADQLERAAKDSAIEIAYDADGLWDELAKSDDWRTYVSRQSDGTYAVQFVSGGEELFFALVDIESGTIVETK